MAMVSEFQTQFPYQYIARILGAACSCIPPINPRRMIKCQEHVNGRVGQYVGGGPFHIRVKRLMKVGVMISKGEGNLRLFLFVFTRRANLASNTSGGVPALASEAVGFTTRQ